LPGASTVTINLQDQQFSIDVQHISKGNGDQMEPQNLIYSRAASYDQVPTFHRHNQAGRKRIGQKIQTQCMLEVAIHSTKYLQDRVFQLSSENGQYFELHQKEH
jgi:hypothetical protein